MPFNGFDIDFKSLRRHRGDVSLGFTVSLDQQTVPPIDVESIRSAADEFNLYCASMSPPNLVHANGWVQLPNGAFAAVLTHVGDWDDVLRWFEVFTQALGPGGQITGGPPERWPGSPANENDRTEPAVFCAYTTSPASSIFDWGLPPDRTSRLATQMANWVTMPYADQYLYYGTTTTPVIETDLALPLAEALDRGPLNGVMTEVREPHPYAKRAARTNPAGLIAYMWWDEALEWEQKRPDLERALLFSPAELECGFVARTWSTGWTSDFSPPWPHADQMDVILNPAVLSTHVPDAHGIQVLRAGHLERAHDLSSWHVQELPGQRYLVTHPDVDDWYHEQLPPEDLLRAARTDFGDMIIHEVRPKSTLPPLA